MQRVMIIGGPGAGKSWLAHHMGECLDLPVVAIDDFVHGPAGERRPDSNIDADAIAAASSERWIIEGGNTRTYDVRLKRADCLIRLRPSRLTRLWRVVRRSGATVSLLRWTWAYDAVFGPKDDAVVASAQGHVACHDLRSLRQVREFLAALPCPSGTPPSLISKGQNGFTTKGSLAPPDRQG
jgi:adenylate kinase family enzyme